ncbi:excalibur calcium-binding domain-containing protein [Pseudarthrobacter sp. NPDC058362]|uniref:excalibur calcium-binding domain-containing protein n=1 Tax=Pseudarthrobacter sp. NPDC058362 TaxID=3346458 RepID=UPI003651B6B4
MRKNPYPAVQAPRSWKPTVLFWIIAALLLLVMIPFAIAGGFGMVLFILGLIALLTGLYAWVFKRRSWVGLPHRKSGGVVAVAGFLALIVGAGVVGATAAPGGDAAKKASLLESATPTPTPTPTETSPALDPCATEGATREYDGVTFVCALGEEDEGFMWLSQEDADRYAAERAAAAKAAADKLAAEKAAAAKAAAEKAAAEKAAAEKAAAARAAAEKAAADQVAREEAARLAAEQAAPPAPPAVPVAPAPAAVYYPNCAAARAAGAAPVYQGTPGYGTHLDRDRDGIGCDK